MQVTIPPFEASATEADPSSHKLPVWCGGVTVADALAELHRVVGSPDFPASKRNRRFLIYVVERAAGLDSANNSRVTAYDIATKVLGRGDDFNTILDPIVRIEAGKLRRDLETYYLKSGRRNPLRLEIPRGGYEPFFTKNNTSRPQPVSAPQATGNLAADAGAELKRLIDSIDFPATPRNRKFLAYVVGRELEGRPEEISAKLIGQKIFGRGAGFNANQDPIVRIEAGKLRRDLETYYLKSGQHNPLRISLPKGGYRPAFVYIKA